MSRTRKGLSVEPHEDARGNVKSADLDWLERHDQWIDDLWTTCVLPIEAPEDENERNALVLRSMLRAARHRGHADLARLLSETTDVFGVMYVLGDRGCDEWETDPVRWALCAELTNMACWDDEIMREVASDAILVWGTGDADAALFLEEEWVEFRVSWRVAVESVS